MHDLLWDDVKDWFDPYENGSAPDVIVPNTTLADWEKLLELIRSEAWRCEYDFRDRLHPLPSSAADLFVSDPEGWMRTLRVWPDPDLEWIVRVWSPDQVDSDVSLHEIQGQERLDKFCLFLRKLGIALGKPVHLHYEGGEDQLPMLSYEIANDRVTWRAGPWR